MKKTLLGIVIGFVACIVLIFILAPTRPPRPEIILGGSDSEIELVIGYELSEKEGASSVVSKQKISRKFMYGGGIVVFASLVVGYIEIVIIAFGTSGGWGWGSLIFWPVAIVFAFSNFQKCKKHVIIAIVGVVVGGGLMVTGYILLNQIH